MLVDSLGQSGAVALSARVARAFVAHGLGVRAGAPVAVRRRRTCRNRRGAAGGRCGASDRLVGRALPSHRGKTGAGTGRALRDIDRTGVVAAVASCGERASLQGRCASLIVSAFVDWKLRFCAAKLGLRRCRSQESGRHAGPLTRQYGRFDLQSDAGLSRPLHPDAFQRLHATHVKPDRFSGA